MPEVARARSRHCLIRLAKTDRFSALRANLRSCSRITPATEPATFHSFPRNERLAAGSVGSRAVQSLLGWQDGPSRDEPRVRDPSCSTRRRESWPVLGGPTSERRLGRGLCMRAHWGDATVTGSSKYLELGRNTDRPGRLSGATSHVTCRKRVRSPCAVPAARGFKLHRPQPVGRADELQIRMIYQNTASSRFSLSEQRLNVHNSSSRYPVGSRPFHCTLHTRRCHHACDILVA